MTNQTNLVALQTQLQTLRALDRLEKFDPSVVGYNLNVEIAELERRVDIETMKTLGLPSFMGVK
jgi:hypothetical protein